MAKALVSPKGRLLVLSRTADEVVLTLRLPRRARAAGLASAHRGPVVLPDGPPPPSTGAADPPPRRVTAVGFSVRVVGRSLLVRGRRRWPAPDARPALRHATRQNLGEWLSRPFSASFALPFEADRSRIHTELENGTLSIRVRRLHDSTPLA